MTRRVVAALLASIVAAAAERSAGAPTAEDWDFSVARYLWAAGTEGTTGTLPGLPPADVDMSFGDVFDDLKPGGMVFFTANRGRLGFATDLQYVGTETQSNALQPLFNRQTLRSTSLVFSALVNYLVLGDGRVSLRLGGGARPWSMDTDLKLTSGLRPERRLTHEETWVDPIVSATGVYDLGPKVVARGWAYIGGFGIASDLTADLFAGLGYRINDSISTTLGYPWVKVDYNEGDFLYDARQEDIATGITVRFCGCFPGVEEPRRG